MTDNDLCQLRHWSFIIRSNSENVISWNPEILSEFYKKLYANPLVGGFACGYELGDATGVPNPHIQGYVRSKTRKRRIQIVKMLQSILPKEVANFVTVLPSKNGAELRQYCLKGEDIVTDEDFSSPYIRGLQDAKLWPEQLVALKSLECLKPREVLFWADPRRKFR